jgi:hypothetical protein
MPSLLVPSVPFYRNPTLRPGLAALVALLMERNYSGRMVGKVYDFAAVHGTLAGSMIEPEDEAAAEAAFVDALPAIDFDSPVWGSDEGLDVDAGSPPLPDPMPEYRSPEEWEATEPGPIEPPDDWKGSAAAGWASLAEAGIAPIAGGAPDFQPSEADLEDYGRWSAALDARRDMIEWYGRNPLAAFNADRAD